MEKIIVTTGRELSVINDAKRAMKTYEIEVPDLSHVSDGYHTITELYDHRITLWIALCRMRANVMDVNGSPYFDDVWRSKNHSDGTPAFGGEWFVLGIGDAKGEQITYHLPLTRWDETDFAETLDKAPEFDGHSSADVIERLKAL